MGTQRDIVALIRKKRVDYVLALKGNQGTLFEEIKLFFDDPSVLINCQYHKTVERARGGMETREYWQTNRVRWLSQKKDWKGLHTLVMTRNTVVRDDGGMVVQDRFFISSLSLGVEVVAGAIRGHWLVESYHWHLDVIFREDRDCTLDKHVVFNLNIMRKLALNLLRLLDVGRVGVVSLRKRRYIICCSPIKYLEQILTV
jgi:predicted transposase YbfD/YdcC